MRSLVVLALCCAAVAASPKTPSRIVGGNPTTIDKYPSKAGVVYTADNIHFYASCGGAIINNRSILTAAHCTIDFPLFFLRIRVGSTFASSGGEVLPTSASIISPCFNRATLDCDISLVRTSVSIVYSSRVQPAPIAGQFYHLPDEVPVWATGWGDTDPDVPSLSEQLQEVELFTVNQEICRERFLLLDNFITPNMLCAGILDVGGKDQCYGDSGSPVYHNGVIVGICSFTGPCAAPEFPGVNARVSRFSTWIQDNA
ncbi:trypsin CFT-1-like [Trichoplusia ni]|uniref:Trypsin CFT-1-like n=1 Tax=Trichoplusia ni TaxID=7111 RepID=A0A7E5VYF2_TRINI|nr:trypsin CFT-1-like [Trichoplusia ni]